MEALLEHAEESDLTQVDSEANTALHYSYAFCHVRFMVLAPSEAIKSLTIVYWRFSRLRFPRHWKTSWMITYVLQA